MSVVSTWNTIPISPQGLSMSALVRPWTVSVVCTYACPKSEVVSTALIFLLIFFCFPDGDVTMAMKRYATSFDGTLIVDDSSLIHDFYTGECERPVHLVVDTALKVNQHAFPTSANLFLVDFHLVYHVTSYECDVSWRVLRGGYRIEGGSTRLPYYCSANLFRTGCYIIS